MGRIVYLVLFASFIVSPAFGESFGLTRELVRKKIMSRVEDPDAIGPQPGDKARDLVDKYAQWNLLEIEAKGLRSAALAVSPWTDSYWPTYAGGLANRYGDPKYRPASLWRDNEKYLRSALGKGEVSELSPAEKYDLLLGDETFTLTKGMLAGAASSAGADGIVEGWFGLCHGWAAASFMLPRPIHAVRASAPNGREITFTPSDIKALGTLLWANAPSRARFVGGRCNKEIPGRGDDGRETDPECFDNNPSTWHLAVVNQIGVANRSFVFDVEEGREVWNQPIYSYAYSYSNPITGEASESLAKARVQLSDYKKDPFRKTRAPQAIALVRVHMTATYISEADPSLAPTDGPENDVKVPIQLEYDLELDHLDNVVGGEWISANHPDFLWVPVMGGRALSVGDDWLLRTGDQGQWAPGKMLPDSWKQAAKAAAQRQQPLARVVEALFEQAGW